MAQLDIDHPMPCVQTTYHSSNYPSKGYEEKWHQHIADSHIPIYGGRGLSSTVHCKC